MAKPLSTTEVIIRHEAATARRAVVAAKLITRKFSRRKNFQITNEIARIIIHAMNIPA